MGKAFRVKIKGQGKRWAKGHSSDSNPVTKKFRNAAKVHFGNPHATSGLTAEALADLETTNGPEGSSVGLDLISLSGGTSIGALSWASATTTGSFSRLRKFWTHTDNFHKEVLAVYGAVTEIISERCDKSSDTAYYAALLTFLDGLAKAEQADLTTVSAAAYLTKIASKRVSRGVLHSSFNSAVNSVLTLLKLNHVEASQWLLVVLGRCLASQSSWSEASTQHAYQVLLMFTGHSKPKVRRAAQRSVMAILTSSCPHAMANKTADYCRKQIEQHLGDKETWEALILIGFLGKILGYLPTPQIKKMCNLVLSLLKLPDVKIKLGCLRSLHGLLTNHHEGSLSTEFVMKLLTALYSYQPSEDDTVLMKQWLQPMKSGLMCLHRLDMAACSAHVPHFATACMKALRNAQCEKEVASGLEVVINCLVDSSQCTNVASAKKVLASLVQGLGYQYQAVWDTVLQSVISYFRVLGPVCIQHFPEQTQQCLRMLSELRESQYFSSKTGVEHAVGSAVTHLGPEFVLQALPLNITGHNDDLEFPRGWLLPVLRDSVRGTSLSHFINYWLPLSSKLHVHCTNENPFTAKVYSQLEDQVWSLLPGYCTRPTDIKQSFAKLVATIGPILSSRPHVRPHVLLGLRKVIESALVNDADMAEVRKFSDKFVRALCALYTDASITNKGLRQSLLQTLKSFVHIAPVQLIETMFLDKCVETLKAKDPSRFMFDLTAVMASKAQDSAKLEELLTLVIEFIKSTDHVIQKKAYQLLECLCTCTRFTSRRQELADILLQSLLTSTPTAKLPRLRCVLLLLKEMTKADVEFLKKVLPEAILCTKANNERARNVAFELVCQLANTYASWWSRPVSESYQEFLALVMYGLGGSQQMKICTILALRKIVQKYKEHLILRPVLERVLTLLTEGGAVQSATLTLLQTCIGACPAEQLAVHLRTLVESLCSLKTLTTKKVFEKLLKKFGFKALFALVQHKKSVCKILKALEKRWKQERKQEQNGKEGKGKEQRQRDSEADSSGEEEDEQSKPIGKKAFLKEEDIIDFTQPHQVAKQVLSSKPGQKRKATWDRVAPDGRLIIDEETQEPVSKKRQTSVSMDSDEDAMDNVNNSDDEDDEEKTAYKPGGKGLHRKNPKKEVSVKSNLKIPKAAQLNKKAKTTQHGTKVQPYAYVPLHVQKNKKSRKTIRKA